MCIHKYYIFTNCGHSFFAPGPLQLCAEATFQPLPPSKHYKLSRRSAISTHAAYSSTCSPKAHPYRTVRIEYGLCLHCELRRAQLLKNAEDTMEVVTVKENKRRVMYQVPQTSGSNFPEGGWAEGNIDVNGLQKQEKRRERSRKMGSGVGGGAPPLSPTSWKSSHRSMESEGRESTRSSRRK